MVTVIDNFVLPWRFYLLWSSSRKSSHLCFKGHQILARFCPCGIGIPTWIATANWLCTAGYMWCLHSKCMFSLFSYSFIYQLCYATEGVKCFQWPGVVEIGYRLASFYPNIQVDDRSRMNLVTSSIFVSLICCSFAWVLTFFAPPCLLIWP